MIEVAVALFLTTIPCQSPVESMPGHTLAHQCPMPPVAGPPRPPFWWGNVDMTRTVHMAADVPETPPKKVKSRVKKKVTRLCGAKSPVWYRKNGKKRYRCR